MIYVRTQHKMLQWVTISRNTERIIQLGVWALYEPDAEPLEADNISHNFVPF